MNFDAASNLFRRIQALTYRRKIVEAIATDMERGAIEYREEMLVIDEELARLRREASVGYASRRPRFQIVGACGDSVCYAEGQGDGRHEPKKSWSQRFAEWRRGDYPWREKDG